MLNALHETQLSNLAGKLVKADIPVIGYIIVIDNIPASIGFLRKMEGNYGMFDTFVTNGKLPSEIRHLAMQTLVDQLLNKAKQLKLKAIISYTSDEGVLNRAKNLGFVVLDDMRLISLSL